MKQNNVIRDSLNENLSGLCVTERQRNEMMNEITGDRKMKKKINMAFVLVCTLMILSITALAVTLVQRSESSNVTVIANQALGDKYGLTLETIGLFIKDIHQNGDEWTVDYIPDGYAPVLLGQYQVIVKGGNATSVTWSYDGTDADLENGDLTSPVWGQKQMEMALLNPEKASAISAPSYADVADKPTPPDLKEGDATWLGQIVHPAKPGTEDLTKGTALTIGKQALMEEFNLSQSDLDGAVLLGEENNEPLFYTRDSDNPIWTLSFYLIKDGIEMNIAVVLDARTGEILLTNLMTGGNG